MITISEVKTSGQLKKFINFPWQIYYADQNWVPPLKKEVRKLLDQKYHPFWEHAKGVLFLAEKNGELAGRISAQVDDNYNKLWEEKLGSFGFFECQNDREVAKALFDAASEWLRKQGMTVMRGPLSPSSNDEFGFLVEGFARPPVLMMPYNLPYYSELAETNGLVKAKDLLSFIKYASTPMPDRLVNLAQKLKNNPHIAIRPVNMKKLKSEMAIIRELYNESWQKNWGFTPMTDNEMNFLANSLKRFAQPEMVLFAFYEGEPAGISITLPDLNQVLKHLNGKLGLIEIIKYLYYRRRIKGVRALIFGFKEKYRRLGLPILLFYETEKFARNYGYEWCELSWNLEDNRLINDFDRELGGEVYKRYRVFEKKL